MIKKVSKEERKYNNNNLEFCEGIFVIIIIIIIIIMVMVVVVTIFII